MIKLPTKSILRFKCVSKSWRSLASSDRFVKAHLEKSSSKHESLERHHMTFDNYRTRAKKRCSLHSLLYGPAEWDDDTAAADFNYPTCAPEDFPTILGSCNGLLCLLKKKMDFILWNPTTRKFRSLPPVLDDAELNYLGSVGSLFFVTAFGFCFDEPNDDYKAFGMWRRSGKLLAKIYSSKTDSWRRVEERPDRDCQFGGVGRFASGKLHWEARSLGGWRIVSFDLENETFGTVEWPGGLGVERDWFLAYAIDGSLCCFNPESRTRPDHIDYWVLKAGAEEEEEGPRWRELATLGCPAIDEDESEFAGGDEFFYPLLFVGPGGGDILAKYNGALAVYAKEEGGGYSGHPKVLDLKGFCHRSVYVESLVEP